MILLTACNGWEKDEKYIYKKRFSYIHLYDSTLGKYTIYQFSPSGQVTKGWESQFGSNSASDFSLQGKDLWFVDPAKKKVSKVNLRLQSQDKEYYTEITPHFVAAGLDYTLVCDSLNRTIRFISTKGKKDYQFDMTEKPSQCLYNGAKFYIKLDNNKLAIYNEKALTEVARDSISTPIQELQLDANYFVRAESESSINEYFTSALDPNGNLFKLREQKVLAKKVRYTPIYFRKYDREYDRDILMINNRLSISTIRDSITDFEVDFLGSVLYSVTNDSIKETNLIDLVGNTKMPFRGKFIKSVHYYDTQ